MWQYPSLSVCLSVLYVSAWNKSALTGGFSWNFKVFRRYVEKACPQNLTRITGTLHGDIRALMIISHRIILKLITVSDKQCRENRNTNFIFKNVFRRSCSLWDNVEKYGTARQATDGNITWRMRFACRVTKATNTHTEYVKLLACQRQKWFPELASLLRYTYRTSPVL